ncbi:MAG: type II secretion system protein XpsN [Arenimonas sp.]
MLEHWRPLTGVLAATCAWAVMVLVLAITGLGGRVELLPDDPAGVAALPVVNLAPVKPRLGQASEYVEVGDRPLLIADRRPVAVGPVAGEGTAEIDVALTSVLITPRLKMAILTDNQGGIARRVRLGDVVPGTSWRLAQVEPRRAVLEGPSGQKTLELRVFNGLGGEPSAPSVVNEEAPPPPPGPAEPVVDSNAGPAVMPTPAPSPTPADNLTQEQQIEAIRRRIEARRAQMRAEAGKQTDDKR